MVLWLPEVKPGWDTGAVYIWKTFICTIYTNMQVCRNRDPHGKAPICEVLCVANTLVGKFAELHKVSY